MAAANSWIGRVIQSRLCFRAARSGRRQRRPGVALAVGYGNRAPREEVAHVNDQEGGARRVDHRRCAALRRSRYRRVGNQRTDGHRVSQDHHGVILTVNDAIMAVPAVPVVMMPSRSPTAPTAFEPVTVRV